jgi:hypothetical protein
VFVLSAELSYVLEAHNLASLNSLIAKPEYVGFATLH